MRYHFEASLALVLGFLLSLSAAIPFGNDTFSNQTLSNQTSSNNRTSDTDSLKTWWHSTGEINTKTPVENGNVRQSHVYNIQVASSSSPQDFYDSFVYESMPRNGNGNICLPGDLTSICPPGRDEDGISIEGDIGADMAWTQYLTSTDSIVRVTRTGNGSISADDVVIRPTTLGFDKRVENSSVLITIPFSDRGYRFSVEFNDSLWEYRNSEPGLNAHYVQNKNPSGKDYVSAYDDSMPVVGVEPLNALLIFVSPFPATENVPNDESNTFYVEEGLVSNLKEVDKTILYFKPGVYWLTAKAHAILSKSVSWVYLAPGAYVKGAFQFETDSLDIKATGFGVASGEQYVYQANAEQGYINNKSDATSLKMWRFESQPGAHLTLTGLTTANPVFNSMDMYIDYETFSVDVWDYKQTGAWFGQTDGIQMYPGSYVRDVFYHVGDDGIKTYYSNVLCERMTVWKTNNAPIVQFGWYSRDISNITVNEVEVIHTRYLNQHPKFPRGLVASAVSYVDDDSTQTANISNHLSNYKVSKWRCEGLCPNLLGINPLENIDTMLFENIWIEKFAPNTTLVGTSTFTVFTDGHQGNRPIALGDNSPNSVGLVIKDFYVGDEHITLEANNWDVGSAGRLNFSETYWGRWTAI